MPGISNTAGIQSHQHCYVHLCERAVAHESLMHLLLCGLTRHLTRFAAFCECSLASFTGSMSTEHQWMLSQSRSLAAHSGVVRRPFSSLARKEFPLSRSRQGSTSAADRMHSSERCFPSCANGLRADHQGGHIAEQLRRTERARCERSLKLSSAPHGCSMWNVLHGISTAKSCSRLVMKLPHTADGVCLLAAKSASDNAWHHGTSGRHASHLIKPIEAPLQNFHLWHAAWAGSSVQPLLYPALPNRRALMGIESGMVVCMSCLSSLLDQTYP